ncbi:MAG: hypothetical protein ACFFD2_25565, partial [Promethearchaeota archaeon]
MVNYPIDPLVHPQWELLFSLDIIMVFIFMEISVFFFHKYLNNKKNAVPSVVELDWGILFCCFGTAYIFYIIGDFYPV